MSTPLIDVAVIGGGPAGMMAAGRAAERGARVLLLEKNQGLGAKLLITGGGRCNIFNAEYDRHRLTERFGKKGKHLFSAFAQFDAQSSLDFFESRGLKIKVEAEQRAFPVTDSAEDVHRVMLAYLEQGGVRVRHSAEVTGFEIADGAIAGVRLRDGSLVTAGRYVLATGGKSRPETGSTGEGFGWLRDLGHTVTDPDPALVPVTLKDEWTKALSGLSLKNVKLTVLFGGAAQAARTGKMLFTHVGVSGPLVLNMSKGIGALLPNGDVTLSLDLFPSEDLGAVDRRLQAMIENAKNKFLKNAIGEIVAPRLGAALLPLAELDPDLPLHQLPRESRLSLARLLKDIPLHVSGLLGPDKAIVTGGGVALDEIDFRTMRSKLHPNLCVVGDVLDFDRPSGGYSLQICWTTGWVGAA